MKTDFAIIPSGKNQCSSTTGFQHQDTIQVNCLEDMESIADGGRAPIIHSDKLNRAFHYYMYMNIGSLLEKP